MVDPRGLNYSRVPLPNDSYNALPFRVLDIQFHFNVDFISSAAASALFFKLVRCGKGHQYKPIFPVKSHPAEDYGKTKL